MHQQVAWGPAGASRGLVEPQPTYCMQAPAKAAPATPAPLAAREEWWHRMLHAPFAGSLEPIASWLKQQLHLGGKQPFGAALLVHSDRR